MNEVTTYQSQQLPDTLADLSKFVLIGREKLNAVRAEIRAIEKVGLAKEVHEQKLHEAQEIAEAVLDAEVRIGELTSAMQSAQGTRTDVKPRDNAVTKLKTEELRMSGFSGSDEAIRKQSSRFEKLARHPEIVEEAKREARAKGEVISRSQVLSAINANAPKPPKKKDPVIEATLRHEEFEEQKKSGVVSLTDARHDEMDKNILARSLLTEIMDCNRRVNALAVFNKTEALERIREIETASSMDFLIKNLSNSIQVLSFIQNKLTER